MENHGASGVARRSVWWHVRQLRIAARLIGRADVESDWGPTADAIGLQARLAESITWAADRIEAAAWDGVRTRSGVPDQALNGD